MAGSDRKGDFESRTREPLRATVAAIQRALEAAGVEFLPENGLRLKAQPGRARRQHSRRQKKPAAGKRTPAPKAKALPMTKEAIRAFRERDAG